MVGSLKEREGEQSIKLKVSFKSGWALLGHVRSSNCPTLWKEKGPTYLSCAELFSNIYSVK